MYLTAHIVDKLFQLKIFRLYLGEGSEPVLGGLAPSGPAGLMRAVQTYYTGLFRCVKGDRVPATGSDSAAPGSVQEPQLMARVVREQKRWDPD